MTSNMTNGFSKQSKRAKLPKSRPMQRMVMYQLERKRFALVSTTNTNATAGIVNNLTNGIVQGDDINQRSGDQIRIVSHELKVRASAVTVSQTFRFIWFRDNMNRGTTPTVTEVLNTANFMSQYSPAPLQQKRFTILRDFSLNCNLTGESIKSRTITLPGANVFYNGATAVAGSNGPGALFLLTIGDSLTGLFDFSYEPVYTDA
jgi:hypothetical protein